MAYGYVRNHTYYPMNGTSANSQSAAVALAGNGLSFSGINGYFPTNFIQEIEVYKIEFNTSDLTDTPGFKTSLSQRLRSCWISMKVFLFE